MTTTHEQHEPAQGLHDLMTPEVNVQRIMRTGTVWFSVAVGTVGVVLGLVLASGWRPARLPAPDQLLWWVGALVVVLSIGLLGWSGCPILEVDVPTADRNKTRTMQWGTALFIIGGALAATALLLGPGS
ncbi:hypothetical protein [Amnibacterium setariae]|uniref:Uncharacterized protein n=1 Tax=Amnibacterium setariae TaxID=2306585 RepID=A0A3A1U2B4_9MICO|nr:hypothetical protein [Amnibacterium setariae]RIX28606.1 hypothetical protein D1781_14445 [Amnibacterium setariae]